MKGPKLSDETIFEIQEQFGDANVQKIMQILSRPKRKKGNK